MRFAGLRLLVTGVLIAGCAGRARQLTSPSTVAAPVGTVTGVWDGLLHETLSDGMGAGDTRVEKQEWHLSQNGPAISGFYLAASTFTSGDGRPYVCSRQASFSALVRFEVKGQIQDGSIRLDETMQRVAESRCTPGQRRLASYTATIQGDVLTLVSEGQKHALYRNHGKPQSSELLATAAASAQSDEAALSALGQAVSQAIPRSSANQAGSAPVDVSGVWIWEHRGAIPTGDEKQEREEWHVDQEGARLSGYYDRVVREISTDGHAFKCSMDTEFEIATRYKFRGEVKGNQLVIYESSFEVLEPSACDNGERRLDAYEGLADGEEVRLIWGVGGQVLRRPRPDVPTQRF
jgi:hypothetical protein